MPYSSPSTIHGHELVVLLRESTHLFINSSGNIYEVIIIVSFLPQEKSLDR